LKSNDSHQPEEYATRENTVFKSPLDEIKFYLTQKTNKYPLFKET
jgi:hypothetical protein